MYLWRKRRLTMGISSRFSVGAGTRGADVSVRAGIVGGNSKWSENLAWSELCCQPRGYSYHH